MGFTDSLFSDMSMRTILIIKRQRGSLMCKKVNKISQLVVICNGSDCKKKGSKDLYKTCRQSLKDLGCAKETLVVRSECTGLCKQAPVVCIGGEKVIASATNKTLRSGLQMAFA